MKKIFISIIIIISFYSISTAEQLNDVTTKQKTTFEYQPCPDKSIIENGDVINNMTPDQIIQQIRNLPWQEVMIIAINDDFILMCKIWPFFILLFIALGIGFYIDYRKTANDKKTDTIKQMPYKIH